MDKKLIVLDLDETLIYGTEEELQNPADFRVVDTYYVYKRPYLDDFLEYCFDNFLVAVWTSSSMDYATEVLNYILNQDYKLCFLWARERCTLRRNLQTFQYYWIKDLHKVKRKGYPLESVLVIDDSPEKHERNYGNLIRISPFNGQRDDDELLLLMAYLEQLKDVPNVRTLDKRRWKQRLPDTPLSALHSENS